MNTKFEEFKELTNYDMIDTYYDDIKDFKYFISNLQEDRVESQKYIVRTNKEIERLNNIINELHSDLKTLWIVLWNMDTEMTGYQNEIFNKYYDEFHKKN